MLCGGVCRSGVSCLCTSAMERVWIRVHGVDMHVVCVFGAAFCATTWAGHRMGLLLALWRIATHWTGLSFGCSLCGRDHICDIPSDHRIRGVERLGIHTCCAGRACLRSGLHSC
jgi:hypothetical protein